MQQVVANYKKRLLTATGGYETWEKVPLCFFIRGLSKKLYLNIF